MQLTRAADYAIRVMLHLASQPAGTVVSKTLLAKAAEAPESFLSKILQTLARAGLIQARRGVVGGFFLLPPGARASLLDVVESIDGPISLNVCVASGAACERYAECPAHKVWLEAQSAMLSVLREAKIAELVPIEESWNDLLKIAEVTGSGQQESKKVSLQAAMPRKPKKHGTRAFSPKGAMRFTRNKKI
jgi:Rrf2 family protein